MILGRDKKSFIWIRHINRLWVLEAEMLSSAFLVLGILVFLAGAFLPKSWHGVACGQFLIVASFPVTMLQWWLLYHIVKCPRCGHNPTRTKDKKHKKMGTNLVWSRLRKYETCPECGDQGPNTTSDGIRQPADGSSKPSR